MWNANKNVIKSTIQALQQPIRNVLPYYHGHRYQNICAIFESYILKIVLHSNFQKSTLQLLKDIIEKCIHLAIHKLFVYFIYIWESTNRSIIFFINFIVCFKGWLFLHPSMQLENRNLVMCCWNFQKDKMKQDLYFLL